MSGGRYKGNHVRLSADRVYIYISSYDELRYVYRHSFLPFSFQVSHAYPQVEVVQVLSRTRRPLSSRPLSIVCWRSTVKFLHKCFCPLLPLHLISSHCPKYQQEHLIKTITVFKLLRRPCGRRPSPRLRSPPRWRPFEAGIRRGRARLLGPVIPEPRRVSKPSRTTTSAS